MTLINYGIAEQKPRRTRWPFWVLGALLLVVLAALMLSTFLTPHEAWGTARKIKCASNLRQIGLGVSMYAADHQGQYPNRFETLLLTEDIGSEVFTCPSSNDEKALGPTAEAAATLSAGGHLSYVYLGKGWDKKTANPSAVLAYESLKNHSGEGGNILYGDGHVIWVNKADPVWASLAKH